MISIQWIYVLMIVSLGCSFNPPSIMQGDTPDAMPPLERIELGTYALEWECLEGCEGGSPWQSQDRLILGETNGSFQRTTCGELCAITFDVIALGEQSASLIITYDWPLEIEEPIELGLVDGQLAATIAYRAYRGDPIRHRWAMVGTLLTSPGTP